MEDSSFIYFTQDDIISKIDIDPRLVDSFKIVLTRIQKYFNEKGYTKDRDYKTFLEKHLLNTNDKHLKIMVDPNIIPGAAGYYNKFEEKICVGEEYLKGDTDFFIHILCHEFIHFLVKHELDYTSDPSIINGGFVNEALTESLAQEIDEKKFSSYAAQVTMHKYANLISGNKNNFRMFLMGKIDARYSSSAWDNYINSANAFQKEFTEKGRIGLDEAVFNKNYIDAQRYLINLFINNHTINNIEDYYNSILKLINRPVKDQDYINDYVNSIDEFFLNKIGVRDNNQRKVLKEQLFNLRELILQSQTNGYSFIFNGVRLTLSEDLKVEGLKTGMQVLTNPSNGTVKITYEGQILELNKKDIDFNKESVNNEIARISNYFTKEYIKNYNMLNSAVEQRGNLLKIEKFKLPNVDLSNKKREVYVATYDNKIVVLNNTQVLSEVENIPINEYLGATTLNPSTSAIYQQQLGNINKGVIYTYLSDKQIYNKAILDYSKVVEELINDEELNMAIEEYKNSYLYDSNESKEDIRVNAIDMLTHTYFEQISDIQRNEYLDKVKNNDTKFIVTMNNGVVDVGIMHGNTSFIAKREVLYDINSKQDYNDIVNGLQQCDIEKNNIDSIEIDSNGNIMNSIDKENKQKSTINKVERLLKINITPISDYIATTVNNFPKLTLKDKSLLEEERSEINRRLTYLFVKGELNSNDYNTMKRAIFIEYNNMISKAPNVEIEEQVSQKTM